MTSWYICSAKNIIKALKQGANGYVLKDIKPEDLILAIKNCRRGFTIIQQQVIDNMAKTINFIAEEDYRNLETLTPRELEVVKLITDGKSNKEIAEKIFISGCRAFIYFTFYFNLTFQIFNKPLYNT